MGGSTYTPSTRRSSTGYSASTSTSKAHLPSAQVSNLQSSGDSENQPINRGKISTGVKNPVVVAFDNTGSMGDWVDEFYKRAPMFYGQIRMHNYLEDVSICLAVVADYFSDREPLQITDFCTGDDLDHALESLYIERNGGGQHKESYQLAAYYFTKQCSLPKLKKGDQKPFFFYFGDEGFYEKIAPDEAMDVFGVTIKKDISSADLFTKLKDMYDVYILRKPYHRSHSAEQLIDKQWKDTLGDDKVVMLQDGGQVVDTMLGIIAMRGGMGLYEYLKTLKDRKQDKSRIDDVEASLKFMQDASVPKFSEKFKL